MYPRYSSKNLAGTAVPGRIGHPCKKNKPRLSQVMGVSFLLLLLFLSITNAPRIANKTCIARWGNEKKAVNECWILVQTALLMFSHFRSSPYWTPTIRAITWFPVVMFFADHGFSYGTVHGRSMQVSVYSFSCIIHLSTWLNAPIFSRRSTLIATCFGRIVFFSTSGLLPITSFLVVK